LREINGLVQDWLSEDGRTISQLERETGVSKQLIRWHLINPDARWTGPQAQAMALYIASPANRQRIVLDAVGGS